MVRMQEGTPRVILTQTLPPVLPGISPHWSDLSLSLTATMSSLPFLTRQLENSSLVLTVKLACYDHNAFPLFGELSDKNRTEVSTALRVT